MNCRAAQWRATRDCYGPCNPGETTAVSFRETRPIDGRMPAAADVAINRVGATYR
jgi:hypothetical protein